MTNFVLVPGAWLGAWAWAEVTALLRADGHVVHAVTLGGLAERRGVDAGQREHVDDIVRVVEENDLRDVVLAGHSYSGIPVGQAAALIGDRLRRVVYVDSNVPVDGQSFVDGWSAEGQAWVRDQRAGHPDPADQRAPHDVHQMPDGRRNSVVHGRRAPRLPVLAAGGTEHQPLADVLPTRRPRKLLTEAA